MDDLLKKYIKVQVHEVTNNVPSNPLVSVCVQTFQHANYIEQCLDGILMQKINFDYEILLGDDESTDGTREICEKYAKKYQNKIRLFLHSRENNIKINDRPTGRFNFMYNLSKARGKYIALCEGDDYWTDQSKLQKQVDFLENHPDYGMVHTDMDQHYVESGKREKSVQKLYNIPPADGDVFYQMLSGKTGCYSPTVMIRKDLIEKHCDFEEWNRLGFFMADSPIFCEISRHSKIKFFDYSSAVRRLLPESATQSRDLKNRIKFTRSSYLVLKYFFDKYGTDNKLKTDAFNKHYHKLFTLGIAAGDKLTVRETYIQLLKNGEVSLKEHIKYILFHIPYLSRIVNISLRRDYNRSEN